MGSYWYIYLIVFWLCIILPMVTRRKTLRRIRRNQRRRERSSVMIPAEFINQYIGKTVTVFSEGALSGSHVEIVDVKDNWIKGKYKNQEYLFNLDMVSSIHYVEPKK
ncbi:MAG: hypothetical protein MJ108_00395 [Saccharofermentans sp.]|nr:hypothetical protein [Saccharofermentans sp.]